MAAAADLPARFSDEYFEPSVPSSAGFYASIHGGLFLRDDTNSTFLVGLVEIGGTSESDEGYRAGGSIGYDFNSSFGVELEGSYASAGAKEISVGPPVNVTLPADGDGSQTTIMANAIVGHHFGPWRPYVGAGAGAAEVSVNLDFPAGPLDAGLHDSDWTWAAQAFAGVDFAVTESVSIGARYRYQYVGETDFQDGDGDDVALDGLGTQSIEAVLKVRFGG